MSVTPTDLRNMLQRLAEKVKRANEIQHSGGKIAKEDWSELHQLTNESFGLLARADMKRLRFKITEEGSGNVRYLSRTDRGTWQLTTDQKIPVTLSLITPNAPELEHALNVALDDPKRMQRIIKSYVGAIHHVELL